MFKLGLLFAVSVLAQPTIPDPATFCNLLVAQCPVHNLNTSTCFTMFSAFTLGLLGDGDVNTIGCRQKYLDNATFSSDPNHCRYAGPSGGGRCGAVLDGVCTGAAAICNGVAGASYMNASACMTDYATIPLNHQWGFLQGSAAATENSLECRVYHATVGAGADPSHCSHWGAVSAQCAMAITPDAGHWCDTLMYNCQGPQAQFATRAQCQGVADGLPNTQLDARQTNSNNTLGCREYHSQASKAVPAVHCEHAGPSGGGVCGTQRAAWGAILAAKPCSDPHVNMFLSTVSNTLADKAVPPGFTAPYNIALDNTGNTQVCRIYHLGVAANVTGHCLHGSVSGSDNCGTVKTNICPYIGAICGFGPNATWQFPDLATCNTQMAAGNYTGGKPWDTAGNTYECRFYHAAVAGSYLTGGANANAVDATVQFQTHCSHVLANAKAGCFTAGSGSTSAPTPAGTTPSAASEVCLFAATAAVFVSVFSL